MSFTITKWGNSLAIRIPKFLTEQLDLKEGSQVDLELVADAIVIRPTRRKKYTLEELLEGMTPNQAHSEISTGSPVGEELW